MADTDHLANLTDKQVAFVLAYVGEARWNATRAAEIAGYSSPRAQGCENLTKPDIRAAIDAILDSSVMGANEVLTRLSEQAAVDIADFIDIPDESEPNAEPRVNLRKAKQANRTHLIKELKPTEHGLSIKLCDSQAALEKLGKYHRLFTEKVDVTSNGQTIASINWPEFETGLIDALAPFPDAAIAVAGYLKQFAESWKSRESS